MATRLNVMLVDDSEAVLVLLQRAICTAAPDWDVRAVRGGKAALKFLEGEDALNQQERYPAPEVLLLDLNMPGMSGFDVLQWVRASARWQHLVVILFSASEEQRDVNRAYALGANSYLLKKTGFEELCQTFAMLDRFWRNASFATVGALATPARQGLSLE